MNSSENKQRMLVGKLYNCMEESLCNERERAHDLCKEYNDTFEREKNKREEIIRELIPNMGKRAYFQGPIFFDFGTYTKIGDDFYANTNLTILDCTYVTIGNCVKFGPNVTLVTPVHPLRYQDRNIQYREDGSAYAVETERPIVIGDNCWLASNVTVTGGVTIGEGCVIGAGSVVTKDIPPHSIAVGNPCKVLRQITDQDAIDLSEVL